MTKGENYPDPEGPQNGTMLAIYRPITCLPIRWKILTADTKEVIYYLLGCYSLFYGEQKRMQLDPS